MSFREIAVFAVTNEFLDSRLRGNDSYEMACNHLSFIIKGGRVYHSTARHTLWLLGSPPDQVRRPGLHGTRPQ